MEKIIRIKCGHVNCYIVSNGKNAVLVDTATEKYREKILEECKDYSVNLILLTHGHIDHVQNAAYLSEKWNVPVAISKDDVGLLLDNKGQKLEANGFFGRKLLEASLKTMNEEKIPPFVPTVFFKEGDTLHEYGITAKIAEVPGHTDGSLAVKVGKNLIVGDALMNFVFPSLPLIFHDRKRMLKSADKIGKLKVKTIYFGHGRPAANRKWK